MQDEQWQKIQDILATVLEAQPEARQALLDSLVEQDPGIRAEIESYLAFENLGHDLFSDTLLKGSSPSDQPQDDPITRIEPYEIVREIGSGGMGNVYLANRADDAYQSQVAIKLLKRGMDTDEIVRRFRNERQILASLNHPHIARLLDGGTTVQGDSYFVMEYIQGKPLDEFVTGLGSQTEKLQLFEKVCQAVHYAHQRSVIHRDLKPSNILVTPQGEPKLLDFGIAKILDPESFSLSTPKTATHMRLMTPKFASPEQLRKEPISTLSDIYNLGTMLYLILVGQHPFWQEGMSETQLEAAVQKGEAMAPSQFSKAQLGSGRQKHVWKRLFSGLFTLKSSGDLDRIVLKAMHLEPDRRYDSALALAHDLERYRHGRPILARGDSLSYVLGKAVARNAKVVFVGGCLCVLSMLFLYTFNAQKRQAQQERAQAQEMEKNRQELLSFTLSILDEVDISQNDHDFGSLLGLTTMDAKQMGELSRDDWHAKVQLVEKLSDIYFESAAYEKAFDLAEKAFLLRLDNEPAESLGQAHALMRLGHITRFWKSLIFAQGYFAEAYQTAQAVLGEQHPDTAPFLAHYSRCHPGSLTLKQSLEMSKNAVTLYSQSEDQDLETWAMILRIRGERLVISREFEAAEQACLEALALHRDVGRSTVELGFLHEVLVMIYQRTGAYDKAHLHGEKALQVMEETVGPDHVYVAVILENLSHFLGKDSDPNDSVSTTLKAVSILEKADPSNRERLALNYGNLAMLYHAGGNYVSSVAYAEKGWLASVLVDKFPLNRLLKNAYHIAEISLFYGDYEYADYYLQQVNQIFESSPGTYRRHGFRMRSYQARSLFQAGHIEEAETLNSELLAQADNMRLLGNDLAWTFQTEALIYLVKGDLDEAEKHMRTAVEKLSYLGGDHFLTHATYRLNLAEILYQQGKISEARTLAKRALTTTECILGSGNERTWEARSLYERLHAAK